MDLKSHWETVYHTKGPDQMSWFQPEARLSRELIERVAPSREARIVDVGAGASTLVDGLLAAGHRHISVLDLSSASLEMARTRLGAAADAVTWIEGDVLTVPFAEGCVDVWHDRAVFHFLTARADRERYVMQVRHAVRPGGFVLVATFAEDGPQRCSGLDVARYSPESLHAEFGEAFRLVESEREQHRTPWGAPQSFTYCLCRLADPSPLRTHP
ncbi:MAG: class I SAM-dependent methyltransferase [Gemmatimonadetes bacterium]|nr:class I SAM-dependent methyltransferase [Gemmatimonadota bacterium]